MIEKIEARSQRQTLQLEEMVRYAENKLECRRAVLLEHFGDEPPAEVRRGCCDVCEGKRDVADFVAEIEEESQQEEPAAPPPPLRDTILDCVREFNTFRTPDQMVDLLHGDEKGFNRFRHSEYHGMLKGYSRDQIRAEIDRLINDQVLSVNGLETLGV